MTSRKKIQPPLKALVGVLIVLLTVTVSFSLQPRGTALAAGQEASISAPSRAKPEKKSQRPKIYFNDPSYDFELQRALGYTVSGGADVNEVLFTAQKIKEGDGESWYEHWTDLARRIEGIGQACLAKGHPVSAREAFFRASMYYRSADFYLHGNPDDPRILESSRKSRETFLKAAQMLDPPAEPVKIPYENTTLPGYILKADDSGQAQKTLILQTGFDGAGEELYFENAFFALKRGYNVLIFEGPGQGAVVREQRLYFRPDWDKVVTPVVDFALTRKEFDPKRLALLGISMGGYLVPRAAAYEHRPAAIIADTGVFQLGAKPGQTRADLEKEIVEMKKDPAQFNQWIRNKMKTDTSLRWSMNNGMFTFGKKTPVDFLLAFYGYNMNGIAGLIKCPTLVVDSQDDMFFKDQAQKLYNALTCPKTFMLFTRDDMASAHCQMGALLISNQRILDWLDETLDQVK